MDAPSPYQTLQFGPFRLDRRGGGLFRCNDSGNPVPVPVGSRALDVHGALVDRPGELVSKDEIMAVVWPGTVVEEANLTVQISTLRRVLDQGPVVPGYIQTVPGRGYRFVAAVTRLAATASPPPSDPPLAPAAVATTAPARRWRLRPSLVTGLLMALLAMAGLAAAYIGNREWFPQSGGPPRLSIVVLPFTDLNNDPEQDYFADAVTDDLTTDLSRISGSVVIAHSTSMTYRNKAMDVKRIGRELDVRYVLEGSVRRMGDQVEVNAQLVDAGTGVHVWAERFETDRRNLAEAQRQITGRLARTLNLEMVEAAGRRIEQERAVDPDANDLAMRGWTLWFRPFSLANRREAVATFERALEIDPRSVEARIGLATILVANMGIGLSHSPELDRERAERLLLGAIEQDANSSRAHEVLGLLRRLQNRLDEARIEYETAVELDRNNSHALLGLGQTLMFLGEPGHAILPIESSVRLDPRDPNAAFADWSLGTCQLLLGHLDESADLLRKARAENPRIYFFHLYLAAALGLRGDIDEARAALAEAIRLNPEVSSLAKWTANQPWVGNRAFATVRGNTLDIGLRRAGMPDS